MFTYIQKIAFTVLFIINAQFLFAQKNFEKQLINNEVTINYPDSTVFAQLYAGDRTIKPRAKRLYLWYRANDIKQTRGGIDGKALDGSYIVYYHDKNLKEKGFTKRGLKKGKWLRWYHNGELQEVIKWRKGRQNGRFFTYSETGKITSKGRYCRGKLHGKLYTYTEDGKFTIKKYKKGVFVKDIEVKEKKIKDTVIVDKPSNSSVGLPSLPEATTPTAPQATKKTWKERLNTPIVWIKSKFKKKQEEPAPSVSPQQ